LSGHGPYKEPLYADQDILDKIPSFSADLKNDNYFKLMNYVDTVVKRFIDKMKTRFPNSLFFIYGDHTAGISSQEYTSGTNKKFEQIPLFLLFTNQQGAKTISTLGSHFDIPATILSLLGIPRPGDWQGIDLLREDREILLMKNSQWYLTKDSVLKKISSSTDTSGLYLTEKYLH
jgi:phosphoglycerol transferase MdoB-like AlkP superfamily enzyme